MTGEITIPQRCEWALDALYGYSDNKEGAGPQIDLYDLPQSVLVDLLADLMHYSEHGDEVDFEHALESARNHYEHEREEYRTRLTKRRRP